MPLTTHRDVPRFVDQELRQLKVAANARIFRGALVGQDRTTGLLRALQTADRFVGIAYESVDNTGGAAGAAKCRVYTLGDFEVAVPGITTADIGRPIYAVDDETLSHDYAVGQSYVGACVDVPSAGVAILRIAPFTESQFIETLVIPLTSQTVVNSVCPVVLRDRPLYIVESWITLVVAPDAGSINIGWGVSEPNELASELDITLFTPGAITPFVPATRVIPAGSTVRAIVAAADSSPGLGITLVLRFVQLP